MVSIRILRRVVAGVARMRRAASSPSSSGMRMSIRTTSGRSERTWSIASRPSDGLADDLHLGLGVEDHAEAGAHERLVVDEQDADHVRDSIGSTARRTKPPPSRGPASSVPP